MNNWFSYESKFSLALNKIFNLVLANLLWLLGCIPIVTIGTSTATLYKIIFDMSDGDDCNIIKSFISTYKVKLKQTLHVNLVTLIVYGGFLLDFNILMSSHTSVFWEAIRIICLSLFILWNMVFVYVYPLLAKRNLQISSVFIKAVKMAIAYFPKTLLLMGISGISCILFLFFVNINWAFFFYLMIFSKSIVVFVKSKILISIVST